MDGLIGQTSPDSGGCDPSPGEEDRRIRQTIHSRGFPQGAMHVCVCVCVCIWGGTEALKVSKVTPWKSSSAHINLKHFGSKGKWGMYIK